ncbi:cryptochrome/photolyase family protein [Noviherbaspirillum denitrificans]|uniref:Deoxyribodipyrimidine photo-lyase n=1 Tax=Noviherbaspirillum denitrificans TaxID=1968433 RepID=A0A254TF70_9BURK|nr:deoxyribodipyrimidine photo-lyase [Noviherbaspirillum denitrificans]OWW19962.1 deoxyribodipyrimidine photolyase [Noviherbaspirillum denitrificans]
MSRFDKSLVWFRRDLRNFDHAALHQALAQSRAVYCAFVFDKEILDSLPRQDRRVSFIHACVAELDAALRAAGGGLIVLHAHAAEAIPRLAAELGVDAVFANHDYEPAAASRDAEVATRLLAENREWLSFKDQVIFERDEVLSLSGKPFSVFTPYKNAWLKMLHATESVSLAPHSVEPAPEQLAVPPQCHALPSLADLGFEETPPPVPAGMSGGQALFDDFMPRMASYDRTRDFPAIKGPSYLSVHLRFGTVSIRGLVRQALAGVRMSASGAATWLSELVWRDFYFMILHHHPRVVERAFRPEYDAIEWESGPHADEMFQAWCEGRTGYPLVDAAMLQLNQTGYMHNRLRMVTASFLVKDLGIDWRRGERYFAQQLNDYDLAANNGGWQWAASTGCDAQPYFRIFNPVTQSEKFDPEGKFIKRYLPALAPLSAKAVHAPWLSGMQVKDYPPPIVQHDVARKRTLERFAVVKKSSPLADHES